MVRLLAFTVLLGVLGSLWFYGMGARGPAELQVEAVAGAVDREREGQRHPARVGQTLRTGDRIVTGEDGVATLSRGGRAPVRIESSSAVRLLEVRDEILELELERGGIRAKVRPDLGATRVVHGDEGLVATDATFTARATDDLFQVDLLEGQAAVEGVADVTQLRAGERLSTLGGEASVAPTPEDLLLDVAWPGDATAAPRITLVGRTSPGARVALPGQPQVTPARADVDGRFALEVALSPGDNELVVAVTDPFGETRRTTGRVRRDTPKPTLEIEVDFR